MYGVQGFRTQRCRDPGLQSWWGHRGTGTQECRDVEVQRRQGPGAAEIQSWGCRDTGLEGTQGCRDTDAGIQDTEMQGSGAAGMQSWWGHRGTGTPGCGDTGMEGPMGADQAGTQRHGDTEPHRDGDAEPAGTQSAAATSNSAPDGRTGAAVPIPRPPPHPNPAQQSARSAHPPLSTGTHWGRSGTRGRTALAQPGRWMR